MMIFATHLIPTEQIDPLVGQSVRQLTQKHAGTTTDMYMHIYIYIYNL